MTIKDIAKLSGFGIGTVSRALNNHPDISQDTSEKIKAIAKEYNFVPNANARQLKQKVSKSIVVIVKGNANLFLSSLLENIQLYTSKIGYDIIVNYIGTKDNEVLIAKQLLNESKPVGILFLGAHSELFTSAFLDIKTPSVMCTTTGIGLEFSNLSSVSINDENESYKAISFLIKNGHKHFGVIGGELELSSSTKLRNAGCLKAFSENGISLSNVHYSDADYNMSRAYDCTKKLLSEHREITAFFCMSDIMAFGTIRAINDLGYKVPDDISVIGFDGIELADYFTPRLTTILQPTQEIVKKSIELLVNMIERGESKQHILVDGQLVDKGSVKSI